MKNKIKALSETIKIVFANILQLAKSKGWLHVFIVLTVGSLALFVGWLGSLLSAIGDWMQEKTGYSSISIR